MRVSLFWVVALIVIASFGKPVLAQGVSCETLAGEPTWRDLADFLRRTQREQIIECVRKIGPNASFSFEGYDQEVPLLHAAVQARAMTAITVIVGRGGASNFVQGDNGMTTAHAAAGLQWWDTRTLRTILERSENLNARTDNGFTPLHIATLRGRSNTLEVFEQLGADLLAVTDAGDTALHLAARNARARAHAWVWINWYQNGQTASIEAVPMIAALADKIDIDTLNGAGETPLVYALTNSGTNPEAIARLVEAGADVSIRAPDGRAPWELANPAVQYRSVYWDLIFDPLEIVSCSYWNTREFARFATIEHVSACLEDGHVPDDRIDHTGETILHLLSTLNGLPPRNAEAVGRSIAVDPFGRRVLSPVGEALTNADEPADFVSLLISAGADVNAQDAFGRTPLHLALAGGDGREAWVSALLAAGADPLIETYAGRTAIDARPQGAKGLIEILREYQ